MRCLLIAPLRYPFVHSIKAGMEESGIEVRAIDYMDLLNRGETFLSVKLNSLPRKVRSFWEKPITNKTNAAYLSIFRKFKPDFVFIYNNQLILPETIREFKQTSSIAFFLGDNPLYTMFGNLFNLHILFLADYIISPDTLWQEQLKRLGIRNVVFDCFGPNEKVFYPLKVAERDYEKLKSDFVFVGNGGNNNWGYKRLLFLNIFKDFDLKAYMSGGRSNRWLHFFPGLESRIIAYNRYDACFNNIVYNCSKIGPIDLVPALFHGVHVRIFDILGAGILPICEYCRDLEIVFHDIDIPTIKDYREGQAVARYWLENDEERVKMIKLMRQRVMEQYSPKQVVQRMTDQLFH